MLVCAGLPGIPIMVWAGDLSDRFGRRLVGCSFALLGVAGGIAFFWVDGNVLVLGVLLSLTTIGQLGAGPILSTYASELFPTALRGQAGSWARSAAVVGGSFSFAMGGILTDALGGLPGAATVLVTGTVIAVVIVYLLFPDTHGRELEDISADGYLPVPLH
jgi:putative MFS transporter